MDRAIAERFIKTASDLCGRDLSPNAAKTMSKTNGPYEFVVAKNDKDGWKNVQKAAVDCGLTTETIIPEVHEHATKAW